MKRHFIGFLMFMATSSFLCAGQFLYICADESSMMTFSESSFGGEPIFTYSSNDGDVVNLSGDELRVRRDFDSLRIVGMIIEHPRFAGVSASFPVIEGDSGTVNVNVRFIDSVGMPLMNHGYECDVKRVAF